MGDFVPPSKLLSQLSKAAGIVRGHDFINLYSHYDADGITSAAITSKALMREGKEFSVLTFTTLNDSNMKIIESTDSDCVLVTDLGASYIDRFDAMPCDTVVLDHHTVIKDAEKTCYANPHLYGIDGMTSGCGATMALLFAVTLNEKNWDLAPIAMAGIAGDKQHLNGMTGLNSYVLAEAEKMGFVEERSGSLIPIGKLSSELFIGTDPYIRGVSGDRDGVSALLKDAGIPENKDYSDLSEEESLRLSSLIAVKLTEQGVSAEKMKEAARTRYYLPDWKTDAETLSSLLNSCGRMDMADVGIAAGMGDRAALDKAIEVDRNSRSKILDGTIAVDNGGLKEMENIQWFDSSESGFTGMVCGTVMSYVGNPTKPTIGMNCSEPIANISSRSTFSQLENGIDMADAMRRGCAEVNGEGGGHKIAAGGSVESAKRDEFLAVVNRIIGEQKENARS